MSEYATFDLDTLIHPLSARQFLQGHWQKRELLVNRGRPGYFDGLLKVSDLDELIATCPLPRERVNLGQSAVGVSPDDYADRDYVRPADLLRLHAQGNTIILRAMHLFLDPLRRLCEGAGRFFHCPAQANIYVTPAGTQSSYPHWDAHDIFVLQLAGSKTWKLFDAEVRRPLYTYEFDRSRHRMGAQTGELTLHAGDVAYIPRGLGHDPVASEYSVHISLGLLVRTWADVFAAMFEHVVTASEDSRTALPVVFGDRQFDVDACRREFPALAARFLDPANMAAAVEHLSAELHRRDRPDVRGVLSALAAQRA